MGQILVNQMGRTTIIPLKEHTILGRSPKSDILIRLSNVPSLWLEIRYIQGHWLWNVLNGDDNTMGAGPYTHNHWRRFSKKIRFNNQITLELIDDTAPQILIEDTDKGFHQLNDFPLIEQVSTSKFKVANQILENGTAFIYDGTIYTIWIPGSVHNTEDSVPSEMDLGILSLNLDACKATFEFGPRKYLLTGESVRALATYALALQGDTPWLTTEEAFVDWVNLGGSNESPTERITWERNKIMGKLSKQGLFPLSNLFQRRRRGVAWEHRLDFSGEIHIVDDSTQSTQ
jgi:hypothetical protein